MTGRESGLVIALLDVSPSNGPAKVRTWGHVVESAAQLWALIPPVSLAAPPGRI
ncbi:MAG: hypothetical protein ACJ72M_04715 [Propionibacteriaceae bacterium]